MTVKELLERVRAVNLETLKELAVEANSVEIARLNEAQMLQGLTAEGKPIRPKYTPAYLKRKQRKGGYSLDGTPNLHDTGEFHKEMDTLAHSGEYFLTSFDEKVKFLPERYEKIFGLTAENIEKAKVSVTNTFVSLWRKEIGL